MKKALITGITGQDGSYLAELLLEKGYEVHGLLRRASAHNLSRIEHLCNDADLKNRLFLHYGDLSDDSNLTHIVGRVQADEIYNLAAMSDVGISFNMPKYAADVDGLGTLRLLDAMRMYTPHARFYQASTSELFGKVRECPQSESTPFYPRSPYAVAKQFAYWSVVNYRESYNLFACNGILFNHESPRRGENFVTRKITLGISRIVKGLQNCLVLGNLDAKRDWGYAKDFVEGMWLMLQQETPEDFVLATGRTTTVRRFVELAFQHVGIDIAWRGSGSDEKGYNAQTNDLLVTINPGFCRPAEVDVLIGNPAKAQKQLGWKARSSLEELVSIMMTHDMASTETTVHA